MTTVNLVKLLQNPKVKENKINESKISEEEMFYLEKDEKNGRGWNLL